MRKIKAIEVVQERRTQVLPARFGADMLRFENYVFDVMTRQAKEYQGGLWKFYELSNGGFYMAPDSRIEKYQYVVDSNYFSGQLSPDAAGIVACLTAFSHLSFTSNGHTFAEHFHWLREFAVQHAEVVPIFGAID